MSSQFIEGAFYEYEPHSRHCREGYAVVKKHGDGPALYLADTFWDITGSSSELGWNFTEAEISSASFLFNPADKKTWREATANDNLEDYEPSDIHIITSQHGHYRHGWVRVGAEPSNRVKLSNLNSEIVEAEMKVKSAISNLRHLSDMRAVLVHTMMEADKK